MRGVCHRIDCRYFHPPIPQPARAQQPSEQTDRQSMQLGYGVGLQLAYSASFSKKRPSNTCVIVVVVYVQ